jgi:hypothetical protein
MEGRGARVDREVILRYTDRTLGELILSSTWHHRHIVGIFLIGITLQELSCTTLLLRLCDRISLPTECDIPAKK